MIQVKRKIDTLQILRAFAAISVVLFHGTNMIYERLGYTFCANIFSAGFSGVDIFFVLSGFIILYTAINKGFSKTEFLKRRFARIYPIYWIVTILLIFSYVAAPSIEQAHRGNFLKILNSLLLWPQSEKDYVLSVAWTLSYEIIFYLVFAFTFLKKPVYLVYAFLGWIILILVTNLLGLSTHIVTIDTLLNPVVINFSFGCLIAYLYVKYPNFAYWRWVLLLGSILFVCSWSIFYYISSQNPMAFANPFSRVYLFGLPAALIIYGALYIHTPVSKVLVYLGDASYSIYLVHITMLSILTKIALKFHIQDLLGGFGASLFIFVCTLVGGCLFYQWIETPLLNFTNKLLFPRKESHKMPAV